MSVLKSRFFDFSCFSLFTLNTTSIYILIALLFHISGAIGLHSCAREWFISMTPATLTLMGVLLVLTDHGKPANLLKTFLVSYAIGYSAEYLGVNTGLLFGDYSYGKALGIKILNVPIMIGLLWFMTILSVGNLVKYLMTHLKFPVFIKGLGLLFKVNVAASLTVLFDFILEPAAIKLGYWNWEQSEIPLYNYVCWYLVSAVIFSFFFRWQADSTPNRLAIALVFIQLFFFIMAQI
mgnify:CR=1 FL=1